MTNGFPKKIYFKTEDCGDGDTYLSFFEDLTDFKDGDEVAVYELKEVKTASVKLTRRLIASSN